LQDREKAGRRQSCDLLEWKGACRISVREK
jgi:hypothetical protein